jgi:amidase
LGDIIAFNDAHPAEELTFFGQDTLIKANATGSLTSLVYRHALENNRRLSRAQGIDAVMTKYNLDALVAPTGGPPWLIDLVTGDHMSPDEISPSSIAAVAGYPHITVPMGFYHGLPVGISFFGRAWSEPVLIKIAYAYEQATKHRRPPMFLPTVNPGP